MKNLKLAACFVLLTLFSATIFGQKMTAEEVISKHLDAIGAKDKRAAIKNQFVLSDVNFDLKGSTVPVNGKAVFVSEGDKNLWGMNLDSINYPQDRFAFDGKDTKVGFATPGNRSVIGGFILSYKELLKEGLLGGVLFNSWALLDTNARKAKINFDGTKKIDDQETYVLEYQPKGGSDLTIKMFFDTKTFRHVRSEYTRVVAARQGTSIDNSAGQRPDYYRVIETFSDFQNLNGLTLPKTYKLLYSYTTGGSREFKWTFNVTNFSVNQALEANSFNIDVK